MWPIVVGVVAGLLILGVTGIAALVVVRRDSGDSQVTATTPVASAAGGSASPSASPDEPSHTKARKPRSQQQGRSQPGNVAALPAGLFCRDLNARGYSYVAAVGYWRLHGNPNQMDADRNGIPCETVYPASDVAGAPLGRVGDTGSARGIGSHLHFGLSWPTPAGPWWIRRGVVPPARYLDAWRAGHDLSPVEAVTERRQAYGDDRTCHVYC